MANKKISTPAINKRSKQKIYLVGKPDNMISGMFNMSADWQMVLNSKDADILCFQGGADIPPAWYGEKKLFGTHCDPEHDKVDRKYWDLYPTTPKVGICRGGQFLNVMSDGEMWQDINNHGVPHEVVNLLTIPGTVFHAGAQLEVTSVHHQMMIPHPEYGEILAIGQRATKFISDNKDRKEPEFDTEVVWYEHTKCLCFQGHPEYNAKYQGRAYFFSLMKYLFG